MMLEENGSGVVMVVVGIAVARVADRKASSRVAREEKT